jgi:hypothetical protein
MRGNPRVKRPLEELHRDSKCELIVKYSRNWKLDWRDEKWIQVTSVYRKCYMSLLCVVAENFFTKNILENDNRPMPFS